MNVLDLFSGACGGWSLGLHRAGFRTVAACEIDEWRRRQFARNFPDAKLYDDIRTVTSERLRADDIAVDVICGSPPCQDASTANTKGRGIDGERTGLYMEAVRLVGEIRPRWYAFENVPGIRNRGIDRVLRELEEIGYPGWPLVVGACDIGAPHVRQRSWLIGADAATVQRLALPWDQPDGNNGSIASVPKSSERRTFDQSRDGQWPHNDVGRWEESSSGLEGGSNAVTDSESCECRAGLRQAGSERDWHIAGDGASSTPDFARDGRGQRRQGRSSPEHSRQSDGEFARQPEATGVARNACSQGLQGYERQPLQSRTQQHDLADRIAGRLGPIAENWNGGIADRFGVDDGLPKGMARPLLAAYGDAIVPQIAEIIGRAIMQAEAVRLAEQGNL